MESRILFFTETPNGDTFYERGCTKRSIEIDAQADVNTLAFCEDKPNANNGDIVQKCYCYDNECNGSASIKSISFLSACIVSISMYFVSRN